MVANKGILLFLSSFEMASGTADYWCSHDCPAILCQFRTRTKIMITGRTFSSSKFDDIPGGVSSINPLA